MNESTPPLYKLFKFKSPVPDRASIFIDFDYTISNFGELKKEIMKNCQVLGIPDQVWNDDYSIAKNDEGIYDTEKHIEILAKAYNVEQTKLHDAFFKVYEHSDKYVYEDVSQFLKFASEKFNIYLFSLGVEIFQFVKREHSNVDTYFVGAINTTTSKYLALPEILKDLEFVNLKNTELIFVDDKADYFVKFENVLSNFEIPHRFIWINRPDAKYGDILPDEQIESNVYEVEDLRRIEDIL